MSMNTETDKAYGWREFKVVAAWVLVLVAIEIWALIELITP